MATGAVRQEGAAYQFGPRPALPLADGLKAAVVDFASQTFFSCPGATKNLSEHAAHALFGVVASFPAGREIVFTYRQASRDAESALGQQVDELGQPWTFHIEPGASAHRLNALGFRGLEGLDRLDADVLCLRGSADGLNVPSRRGIAAAVVGDAEQRASGPTRTAHLRPEWARRTLLARARCRAGCSAGCGNTRGRSRWQLRRNRRPGRSRPQADA
jgi:hypothetical protein